MISKKFTYYILVIAMSFLFSLPLAASTLTINADYEGYSGIKVALNGTYIGESAGTGVGMFQVRYNDYDVWGFCIDLETEVGFGENSIDSEIAIAGNLIYAEWLVDKYAGDLYSAANSGENVSPQSAALQLAIWEVLLEDSYTAWDYADYYNSSIVYDANGNFVYDRTQVSHSNGYGYLNEWYDFYVSKLYGAVTSSSWSGKSKGGYIVLELSQNDVNTQNIIVNVVPEPTTALLLGFGLLGLCAVGRKRA